jgi:uncharacterized delta-60 repeat protein
MKVSHFTASFCFLTSILLTSAEGLRAAAPGSLDTTFGIAGKVSRDIEGSGYILDAASQSDGKILLVGHWQNDIMRDFIVIRLNSNGDYDPTFGSGGILFTDFSGRYDEGHAIAIQNDGKIVVAGTSGTSDGFSDTALARYLPNGDLDTTFDGDGKVLLNAFPPQFVSEGILSLAIQPDGRIVAGGSVETDFLLFRFNLDGSLDPSFGNGGVVVTGSNPFADDVREVALLSNGQIVAAGGSGRCVAARYNPDGTLDASFGTSGLFVANVGFYTQCFGLDAQADGKLVLAGEASPNMEFDSFVLRLTSNGFPDPTFGNIGFVVSNLNPAGTDVFTDLALLSDGRILATGFEGESPSWDFSAVRLNNNGTNDTSFANSGIAITEISGNDIARTSLIYGDKFVVVGDSEGAGSIKVARYQLSATPTSSADFDGDGKPDYAVFRPTQAAWFVLVSSNFTVRVSSFGSPGDIPLDGDFDGDGSTDLAIFRPSAGQWWINRSSDRVTFAVPFGITGDRPVAGDYDKDGRTDIAVWNPTSGSWSVLRSSDGNRSYYSFPFGQNGDIPIQAAPAP